VSVSGFQVSFFDRLAFSIPAFSVAPALTRTNRALEVARIFTKYSKCCDKFFVLTVSLYAFISLLYKQLLQYTLLKSFTLIIFRFYNQISKKFHAKLLASAFIFINTPRKHFSLTPPCFNGVVRAIAKYAHIVLTAFLSMSELHCKRHYKI